MLDSASPSNSPRLQLEILLELNKSLSTIKRCFIETATEMCYNQIDYEDIYLDGLCVEEEKSNKFQINVAIEKFETCLEKVPDVIAVELEVLLNEIKKLKADFEESEGGVDFNDIREFVHELIPAHEDRIAAAIRRSLS